MGTLFRLRRMRNALNWAKMYLPPQQYSIIDKSYRNVIISTVICCLCCLPFSFLCAVIVIFAPFSHMSEDNAMPIGATTSREARIDYDDNFYWTYDSKVYKEALEDYGLNPDDYEPHDTITIYIDDDQNVYKVSNTDNNQLRQKEIIIGTIIGFAIPILILLITIPIICTKIGKPLRDYLKWYYQRFY